MYMYEYMYLNINALFATRIDTERDLQTCSVLSESVDNSYHADAVQFTKRPHHQDMPTAL